MKICVTIPELAKHANGVFFEAKNINYFGTPPD